MRDAVEGLSLTAQTQESLAFEIQQLLFAERGRILHVAAGEDPRELAADQRVVIADAAGARGEVDAELERGENVLAADADRGARRHRDEIAREEQRLRLCVFEQAIAVHRD